MDVRLPRLGEGADSGVIATVFVKVGDLVKKDQPIAKGQKIAEVGRSDSDVPKLHFEIRSQGKPIDPLKLLPPRQ